MISHNRFFISLVFLLCLGLSPVFPSHAETLPPTESTILNFPCYRDAASLVAKMVYLANQYPNLITISPLGSSVDGRQIAAYEIGNKSNEDKPHFILLTGLHGNDFSQPELGLQLAETLLEGYETSADLRWIVDNVELDLILLANPDGRLQAEGLAQVYSDSSDISSVENKNNVDLEEDFCFPIAGTSVSCSGFTYQPETQAIITYLNLKLGEIVPNQQPLYDSQTFFIYFSSHNKETNALDPTVNLKGKLRIPKFFTPNSTDLSDPALLRLQALTEMLRIVGTSPIQNIEIFKTEGPRFDNYPVDFTYFTHGIASVELSAPPTYDSRPMECYLFTTEHVQNNTQLLLNAAKSAAQPYKIGYGPIVKDLEKLGETDAEIRYHAVIWEKNQTEGQYEQNLITSVNYRIDQPAGMISGELEGWKKVEGIDNVWEIDFGIDISTMELGRHILTLQACSQDEFDNTKEVCGLPLSAFLTVPEPGNPGDIDPPDDPDPPDPEDIKIFLPLIGR